MGQRVWFDINIHGEFLHRHDSICQLLQERSVKRGRSKFRLLFSIFQDQPFFFFYKLYIVDLHKDRVLTKVRLSSGYCV